MDKVISIEEVKYIMEKEPPMLFLGAGFSLGATNEFGDIPLGDALKHEIIDKFIQGNVDEESLKVILSILVDTFFTRISMPKLQHSEIRNISVA